jgi:hypothetical protein
MAAPSAQFDQTLSAATYKYLVEGKFVDNIFTGAHTLALFKKYGGVKEMDGGHSINVPLEYATNPTVGASAPWAELTFQETDEFTTANFDWKQIDGTLALSMMDIARNAGEARIVDLQKAKISNLERSMRQDFNRRIFSGTASPFDSLSINGLFQLVSSSGTIGGIDSSAQSWWRSSVLTSGVALDEVMMETQYHNAFYDEAPQVIITTQALFEKYMDLTRGYMQVNKPDAKVAELGFESATFKGKPIVWDRDALSGKVWFLNFNYLKLCPHKQFNFKVSSPIELQKQHVMAYKVLWIGNMVITNRRMCSLLQAVTA